VNKKLETQEFNIPNDDIECWERYPKHRWVYDLSRLLDAQNIKWSPFATDSLTVKESNMRLVSNKSVISDTGYIYVQRANTDYIITELYIVKGEIKLIRYVDPATGANLSSLHGNTELRLNAFVSLYFQKFTGVFTAKMISDEIYGAFLRPYLGITYESNQDIIKLVRRIYKKSSITVNGLTDQVHQELLAT
jgi:hypothetical protein